MTLSKYFDIDKTNKKAKCLICLNDYSYKSSSSYSNLLKHLRNSHNFE